jgi:type VI protein secretion system component VasF
MKITKIIWKDGFNKVNNKQRKSQEINVNLSSQNANNRVQEIGQSRREKTRASCLVEDIDNKNALTPAMRELLEASLTLQTTNTKILAAHLGRSPATIRTDFNRFLLFSVISLDFKLELFTVKELA